MIGILPQHNEWKDKEGKPFFHNNVITWNPKRGNKVKVRGETS